MKRFTISLFVLLIAIVASAQQGWRDGEMEVKITLQNQADYETLHSLRLNGDVYADGSAIMYVIPGELEKIRAVGLDYNITKSDLNSYYTDFWNTRAEFHTYQEIIDLADSLAENFPDICKKYTFGESVGGRQLAALKISDNVGTDETEAEVLMDGGIHGDEICAAENLIRLARDFCIGYGTDPQITDLIDNREIWFYMMVNPDGRANMTRYNDNGVDLNRDWGYMWDGWGGSPDAVSQVETQAERDFILDNQFSIALTYHAGVEMAIFPWGYRYEQANDFAHNDFLAELYSDVSGYDNLPHYQATTLYPVNGSTCDYFLGIMGSCCMTMEISSSKQPPASQLMYYYTINVPSMMAMIEQAGYGVEGLVTDAETGDPVAAFIFVDDYYPAYCDPVGGDYHKYVLPGTYTVKAVANGYETQVIEDVVVEENSTGIASFSLQPIDGQYGYMIISSRIPDNNYDDEGDTPAALGPPDEINYSIGKSGWVIIDLQFPVLDGPGDDITVYEGDETEEGYICFTAEDPDGPWFNLGVGEGTSGFDLGNANVPEARYFKILDDGDGNGAIADAGFDLDAIEGVDEIEGVYITILGVEINDETGNGNGYIDPGETITMTVTIRNNGNEEADNIIGSIDTESPFVTIDEGMAEFGSLAFGESSDGSYIFTTSELTPTSYVFTIILELQANNGSYNNTYEFTYSVGQMIEDWETGTFDLFEWTHGGNQPWTISETTPYQGSYCVESGNINDSQNSEFSISLEVTANGDISFARKVSSETGYDFLEFYIDNNRMGQWSGEMTWEEVSYPVMAGTHAFKWIYIKDTYVSSGQDRAWIDQIIFPPIAAGNLGTLSGTVTDAATGLPIEGAIVGGVYSTDEDGTYSFEIIPGNFEICAYHENYEMLCLDVTITANEISILDFELVSTTGITDINTDRIFLQNFPNPFSDKTLITTDLKEDENLICEIFDINGELVISLFKGNITKGTFQIEWDGTNSHGIEVTPGIYFCKIRSDNKSGLIKLVYH
jgi:hypothetical protein